MADDLGLGSMAAGLKTGAAGLYDSIYYIIFVLALLGLIIFIWWWMSHNRLVMINYKTKGGITLFISDMAKKTKIKGAEYWKLRRLRKAWLPPPEQALRITSKGKFCAECIYTEGDDHPIWVEITEGDVIDQEGKKINRAQSHFAPEDKALLVEQIEEANDRNKSLLKKLLELAPALIILMIFVLLLVFWGDIWEPMKQSQQQMGALAQAQAQTADAQGRIMLLQLRLIEAMMEKRIIDPGSINVQQEIQANAALLGLNQTGAR